MRKLSLSLPALLILFLMGAAFAVGQTTGSIRGVALSPDQQPLPGVSVEARSPALQGSRTAVTDKDGRFSLSLLPPGSYTVKAELPGFGAKAQTVKLGLDQDLSVRFELTPVRSETVSVTAEAPQIETSSNSIGRNLDSKLIEALPTGRNYSSVVQLNAGVGTDASDDRNTSITVYGSTGLEKTYLVDGANTTGVEFGSQGKVLNFEFVQEVEFKSGGYQAEYGHSMGGILNVVTKSGGNDFHGDAFGYLNRNSLQADSKHQEEVTPAGVPIGFTKEDFGVDLGGFVVKDKLWFFGAYDRVNNTLDRNISIGDSAGTAAKVRTTSDLYSGKLTWHLSDQHTVIGTVFGDPTTDSGAVGQLIGPPSTFDGDVTVGGTDWGIRYEGIFGSHWLVTAQGGRHTEDTSRLPGPDGNQIAYQDLTGEVITATGGFGGVQGNGQWDRKKFTRDDFRLDGTYLPASHEIKGGFEYERIKADVLRNFSGAVGDLGGQLVQMLSPLEGDTRPIFSHIFFASINSTVDNPVSAPLIAKPQHDIYTAFLQDSWKALPNLTINAGVRWERQLIKGASYNGEPGSLVTGPLITYINVDHFSPRVGFSWDFLKDGKTKFFASYGQFVEAVPMDMNIRSLNGERDATTFNFDPVSVIPDQTLVDAGFPTALKGSAVNDIDPNLKSEYMEEIVVGVDRQVGKDWTLGLHGIYRSMRRVIEDTCVPADVCDNYAFFNPGSSTEVCLSGVCQPLFPYPPARRYFRGIEVTAQKRLADRWLLYASYLYSHLNGNFDGSFRAFGGFNKKDPNITDDFDYPEFVVNSSGKLTLDRPHQVKLQAAYVFPFNLTASFSGYYISGAPLSKLGWWDGYGAEELFLTPRGSEGRSPSLYEIDAHLDYGLGIGPVTIHILADAFNILNRQQAVDIDQIWAFQQSDNSSPVPTNSHYGQPNTFQQPRTLRLGLRVSF